MLKLLLTSQVFANKDILSSAKIEVLTVCLESAHRYLRRQQTLNSVENWKIGIHFFFCVQKIKFEEVFGPLQAFLQYLDILDISESQLDMFVGW